MLSGVLRKHCKYFVCLFELDPTVLLRSVKMPLTWCQSFTCSAVFYSPNSQTLNFKKLIRKHVFRTITQS